MNDPRIDELRRLGADPDVNRMISQVLQQNEAGSLKDLGSDELDMLIELSHDMLGQLDAPTVVPPGDQSGWIRRTEGE